MYHLYIGCVVSVGGMQDYNYIRAGCLEITLETSCCKYPMEADLEMLWEENRDSMINYPLEVHMGKQRDREAVWCR